MKNIHLLPTPKPSRLYLTTKEYVFEEVNSVSTDECQNKHIYITSDEEIKDGDYYLYLKNNSVQQFIKKHHTKLLALDIQKKIILTTDQDLIKDGVQAIDDEFLEWFVKNPSYEKVELIPYLKDIINPLTNEKYPAVQHRHFDETKMIFTYHYQIIIPKEEPKQEYSDSYGKKDDELRSKILNQYLDSKEGTLEKAIAKGFIKTSKEIDYTEFDWTSFKLGAKWQAERMYSEEEVMDMFHNFSMHLPLHYKFLVKEQFKKK